MQTDRRAQPTCLPSVNLDLETQMQCVPATYEDEWKLSYEGFLNTLVFLFKRAEHYQLMRIN